MQQKRYGLLGYPLSHSFSKSYFESKFLKENIIGCTYDNFEFSKIDALMPLMLQDDLFGFNVTIPYKKLMFPLLNEIDNLASAVGAVNCVKRIGNSWKGYNTDVFGFEHALKPLLNKNHTNALILGTGGASQAIAYVLEKLGIGILKVSSHEQEDVISYYDLDDETMAKNSIIINTTPLGTFPNTDEYPPIPYECLTSVHLCYDLIYNPEETLFLKKSHEMGAQIKNGYEMLVLQAEESWRIWNSSE